MIEYVGIPIGTGGTAWCTQCAGQQGTSFRPIADVLTDVSRVVADWDDGTGPNVTLHGVDPFKHPELPSLIDGVAGLGVKRLGMLTDGVALSTGDNATGCISAGVRHLEVALLAGDAESHDHLSRLPGSFDAALSGIGALTKAAQEAASRIVVCGRARICRHNYEHAPGIVCAFAEAGAISATLEIDRSVNRSRMRPLLEAAIETGIVYGVWVSIEGLTEAELGEYAVNMIAPAYTVALEEWHQS